MGACVRVCVCTASNVRKYILPFCPLQIRKMLTVDPHCRLTAREALGHPWLCFVQVVMTKCCLCLCCLQLYFVLYSVVNV